MIELGKGGTLAAGCVGVGVREVNMTGLEYCRG